MTEHYYTNQYNAIGPCDRSAVKITNRKFPIHFFAFIITYNG